MKRTKHSLPLRLTCLGSVLLVSAALSMTALVLPAPNQENVPVQAQFQASLPEPEETERHRFLIRSGQGVVCVYRDGTLIYKTAIPVASLPEQDRNDLAEGIEVDDETEMHRLLEDFGA